MVIEQDKETEFGNFHQDLSGLWHYEYTDLGHIGRAVSDALKHRPDGAAWFWFNGTPCPIHQDDSHEALRNRWYTWRNSYQENRAALLILLADMSKKE
jgi:hypothetical protein